MKKNEVYLTFEDKTVPSLAGYDYGVAVFKEQVEKFIDYSADEIIICFPTDKSAVASSFVEGFFDEIKKNIGLSGIFNKVKIDTIHESLSVKIMKAVK